MLKTRLATAARILALMLIVTACWCVIYNRTTVESWKVPMDYRGEPQQIMGWIKAAAEGDYLPFWSEEITRLGAPYHADWNDYPMYEKILTFGLGMVSRVIGIYATTNAGMLLAHWLGAISFYLCCRFMKYSRTWSFVGALLFCFTYYHFYRKLGHLLLAFTYPLPWAMVSCWIIVGSKQMRLGDRLSWLCLITALVMGLGNPYSLNMYVQLLCFSVLAQFLLKRRKENLRVGLLAIAIAGAAFIAINLGTFTFQWTHGKNPSGLDRHYFESELYALKPMEFVIPPTNHNVPALANLGSEYLSSVYVRGEVFSPYLGIIGVAGLLWLFGESVMLVLRGAKRIKPFPPYALQCTWIIFYSIVGGVNCLISFGGIQLFRGSNRYSIFISTIVLLFLVSRLSVWSRHWSKGKNFIFALLVVACGLLDQMPQPASAEDTTEGAKLMKADEDFGRQLEEKLPAHAMVYELPVMVFPEAVPTFQLNSYELLRPYFSTQTLRFSFGSVRGRNREAWQWEVEKMPVPQMIATLEKYGFAAIYINRIGYADKGAALLKQFAEAGLTPLCEDSLGEQICFALHPSPNPELPHTDDRAQILFTRGWVIKEHSPLENQEWASGNATLSFFSESNHPATYSFRCQAGTVTERQLSIEMGGRQLWSSKIPAGKSVMVDILVTGHPGNNAIHFKTDAPPAHIKETPLPLAFSLINVQITRISSSY